jgi:hypothetical protein
MLYIVEYKLKLVDYDSIKHKKLIDLIANYQNYGLAPLA